MLILPSERSSSGLGGPLYSEESDRQPVTLYCIALYPIRSCVRDDFSLYTICWIWNLWTAVAKSSTGLKPRLPLKLHQNLSNPL